MNRHSITLDGRNLTIYDIVQVAEGKAFVSISSEVMERIVQARRFVHEQIGKKEPVYGFNRGVGLNKDQLVSADQFASYNRDLIFSHCISVKPEARRPVVRAAMLIRLNTLLLGYTGVQPDIVRQYQAFLNKDICPVVYERGSVGAADIGCLSAVGYAMLGEGDVYYQGVRMSAGEALQSAGLKKTKLGPKDALAIVSSNALGMGKAALLTDQIEKLIDMADAIYALSLEGLDGNVTPLDQEVVEAKKMVGQRTSASLVRKCLEGSYLWHDHKRLHLQDPLSFRGGFSIHGSVRDALQVVKQYLAVYVNAAEDNPMVLIDQNRIISSANYEITSLILAIEMLNIALCHLSRNACFRIMKLETPAFTGLTRFLAPNQSQTIGFSTMQKTFAALDVENQDMCHAASANYYPLAGDIEDHATNSIHIIRKSERIVDNIYYILGIEAMHAAQAVDLRSDVSLGKGTKEMYRSIRQTIPFLDKDRHLSDDIEAMYQLLKSEALYQAIHERQGF